MTERERIGPDWKGGERKGGEEIGQEAKGKAYYNILNLTNSGSELMRFDQIGLDGMGTERSRQSIKNHPSKGQGRKGGGWSGMGWTGKETQLRGFGPAQQGGTYEITHET